MEEFKEINDLKKGELYHDSYFDKQIHNSKNDVNNKSFSKDEPISKGVHYYYHYLCPNWKIFPFIEFTNSKKYIIFSCSCYNNKEILIKDLLDVSNNYILTNDLSNKNLFSLKSDDYERPLMVKKGCYKELKCTKHNLNFEYFCKTCLLNICEKCKSYHADNPHDLINISSINIDNKKLNEIITLVEPNSQNNNINNFNINENIQNKKSNLINDNEEELNHFNKLISIIIN